MARPGLGSELVTLPQKLSSSAAGKAGVRVGAADQPELVGVHAELGFQFEAVLERRARVFELQHLRLLRHGKIEVGLVPALEIGELVVGRQQRVGFAIALHLGSLIEHLPTGTLLGILAIDLLAGEGFDDREHRAVAEIAVVGDGENLAAGLVLVLLQPFPKIARIVAPRRQRRKRHHLARLVGAVAENDIAVKVVATGVRGPLIADDGSEPAGVVRLFGSRDRLLPSSSIGG